MEQSKFNWRALNRLGSRQKLALFIWGVLVLAGLGVLLGYLLINLEAGSRATTEAPPSSNGSNSTVAATSSTRSVPTVTSGANAPALPSLPSATQGESLPSGGAQAPLSESSPTPEAGLVINFEGSPVATRTVAVTFTPSGQAGSNAPVIQSTENTTRPTATAPSVPSPTIPETSPAPVAPEATATPEAVPPTATNAPEATATPQPAPTATATLVPATATAPNPPSPTPATTIPARPQTATAVPTTAAPTATVGPTATPTLVPPTLTATAAPTTVRPTPTVTATVVSNSTPIPSATPQPTVNNPVLKAEYRTGNSDKVTKEIRPEFTLSNSGNGPVSLKDITIRYWFTSDNDQPEQSWCDYAQTGCANLTAHFVKLSKPAKQADSYLEVGFGQEAGVLAAGSSTGEIKVRFAKQDWSDYQQNDDYSFDGSKSNFVEWKRITLYRDGKLIWGTEPNGK